MKARRGEERRSRDREGRELARSGESRDREGKERGEERRRPQTGKSELNEVSGSMTSRASGSIVLTHAVGLHARPSVKLTKLAKTFASAIRLGTGPDGPWIDAKSIVKVMAAKVPQGSRAPFRGRRRRRRGGGHRAPRAGRARFRRSRSGCRKRLKYAAARPRRGLRPGRCSGSGRPSAGAAASATSEDERRALERGVAARGCRRRRAWPNGRTATASSISRWPCSRTARSPSLPMSASPPAWTRPSAWSEALGRADRRLRGGRQTNISGPAPATSRDIRDRVLAHPRRRRRGRAARRRGARPART